jgi:hypothetical protein
MSSREATTARRWYPARWFLPHEPRHPPWFHALEVALVLIVPVLPLWALFIRARVRHHGAARAAAAAAAGAPAAARAAVPPPPMPPPRPPLG